MSPDIFWFLPTSGDSRYLGQSDFGRASSIAYLRQVAVSADELGYDGVLIPTGSGCHAPRVVASAVAPARQRLKFLVALRTSLGNPTSTARAAATLDQATHGRLLLTVVPESFEDFADIVVPELQSRGLHKTAYTDGSLRHKLFGEGDRLPARHAAARFRDLP